MSIALCHSVAHEAGQQGGASGDSQCWATCQRWPYTYRQEVQRLQGELVVLAAMLVAEILDIATYHAEAHSRNHCLDQVYKPLLASGSRSTDRRDHNPLQASGRKSTDRWRGRQGRRWQLRARVRTSTRHKFGSRDLKGNVLLSPVFFRVGSDFQDACQAPPGFFVAFGG